MRLFFLFFLIFLFFWFSQGTRKTTISGLSATHLAGHFHRIVWRSGQGEGYDIIRPNVNATKETRPPIPINTHRLSASNMLCVERRQSNPPVLFPCSIFTGVNYMYIPPAFRASEDFTQLFARVPFFLFPPSTIQ